MHFQPTQPSEATAIYNILDACRTDMLNRGIQQWDETYPTLEMVKKDISTGGMYTIIQDDELIGAIVMDEKQSPQYEISELEAERRTHSSYSPLSH
jgi:hypothetical protein